MTIGWTATSTSSNWAASCRPFPKPGWTTLTACPAARAGCGWRGARRDGKLYLAGTSDAAIVSGLISLLLRVYSGRTPAEITATGPEFLKELGLLEALSTNRGNGIAAMVRKIREVAALEAAAG